MIWFLVASALAYVIYYGWVRFTPRRPSQPLPRVVPWNRHLYVDAPTDASAAEAFLRADLELARRGQ